MARPEPLIVLVDDDPDFLEINARVLESAGYRVLRFAEPQAALAHMAAERPDLVVTDLMMCALDSGFSFSRQLRADPRLRDLPVVIVTSIASRLGLDFAPLGPGDLQAMGADAFLEKPVAPDALLATLEGLLEPPPARDEP